GATATRGGRTPGRTTGQEPLMPAPIEHDEETEDPTAGAAAPVRDERYKWGALANTTAAVFMAMLDGSIVIIAMPAIFRGIHLDPLAPGNIFYLLWMIMGYRL